MCLAVEPGCTAVGSQSHVTLLDPRKKGPAQYIQNMQGNCVRHGPPDCHCSIVFFTST